MEITELQKDLAATFRWTARLNMHEAVANHFSACVPGSSDFYVNKAGIHFSQIKASDLILITKENIEELRNKPEVVDSTALNIHGTIHEKAPHAKCIFHLHSKYATVLSTLKDPTLKPIDQNTMFFYNRVAVYDDFGGLGFEEESIKMANALGNKQHMILANHGIITTGETVAEGFNSLYYFEKAAETYITALSTNKNLNIVIFDEASEGMLNKFKMGAIDAKANNRSTMVVESRITYNNEVKENEEVDVYCNFFDHDKKRLVVRYEMYEKETKKLAATLESMSLYIDLEKRKVTEFEQEKLDIMDKFINENKEKFNSENLVLSGKLKK